MTVVVDPIKVDTPRCRHARSARRQRLVTHLHAAGPAPCLEALIEVAHGRDLDDVRFARVPVSTYRAVVADVLSFTCMRLIDRPRKVLP